MESFQPIRGIPLREASGALRKMEYVLELNDATSPRRQEAGYGGFLRSTPYSIPAVIPAPLELSFAMLWMILLQMSHCGWIGMRWRKLHPTKPCSGRCCR